MSNSDDEPSGTATIVAEPLAVVTVWTLVFLAAEFLAPAGLPDVVVAGLAGGLAFVISRRCLRVRRENESS